MKTVLLALAACAAFLATGAMVVGRWSSPRADEPITGSIEAIEVDVASEIDGRIVTLAAQEGQRVKRGDVLAALDDEEARLHVDELTARIQVAKAELADLAAAPRPAEVQVQRSRIDEAKVALAAAKTQLNRASNLAKHEAAPRAAVEDAHFNMRAAAQRARIERSALGLLEAPPRETKLDVAQARIGELEADLRLAQLQLKRTRILAPCDGIVSRRHREAGEVVTAGAPLVTLIDPSQMWVELAVPARLQGRLIVGQAASVALEGASGPPLTGHVTYVAERHIFTPRNVQTREERALLTFRVKVTIDRPPATLKPGMYADVTFAEEGGRQAPAQSP